MTARTREPELHGTTILSVRHRGRVVLGGDGQVTLGQTVHEAQRAQGAPPATRIACSPASPAPAPTRSRCSSASRRSSQQVNGNLRRAAVELAKDWRTDRLLRRLEALLVVADRESLAHRLRHRRRDRARGRRLRDRLGRQLRARRGARAGAALRTSTRAQIAEEAMRIAAAICVYTNDQLVVEELDAAPGTGE